MNAFGEREKSRRELAGGLDLFDTPDLLTAQREASELVRGFELGSRNSTSCDPGEVEDQAQGEIVQSGRHSIVPISRSDYPLEFRRWIVERVRAARTPSLSDRVPARPSPP